MIVIPRSHSRFAQFRVLIFNFGYKKFWNDLYCCNFMYWAFSPGMGPSQNLNFLIIYFDSHTWSRRSLWLWNETISKLIFFNYLFWFSHLIKTWFMECICFEGVGSWFQLEDLMGIYWSFLSSISCTNCSWKGEIRFSWKSLMVSIVICTTNDHTFNGGVFEDPRIQTQYLAFLFWKWNRENSDLQAVCLWRIYGIVENLWGNTKSIYSKQNLI